MTFNLEAIATFIYELRDLFECDFYTHQNLERYQQIIRPNDATLQSKLSLLLLEYLLTQPNQEIIAPPSSTAPTVYICQPMEDAIKSQEAHPRQSYAFSPLPASGEGLGVGCNDCGLHN